MPTIALKDGGKHHCKSRLKAVADLDLRLRNVPMKERKQRVTSVLKDWRWRSAPA